MMVIAKLLLVVLVLRAGSSTVSSSMYHHNTMRKFGGKLVCDKYILPRNAVWTPRTNCEGSKRFKCQPGYESRVQTRCKKGVVSLEPTCHGPAPVKCLSGEKIANSENVTQSKTGGEDFEFSCQSDSTEYGTTGILTCGENGNWTIKKPCKGPDPVTCLSGEKIANSENVTQSRTVGEYFEFSCQSVEYGTTGILTCGENGNWTIKKPCEVCYQPRMSLIVTFQTYRYKPNECEPKCDQDDECSFSVFGYNLCFSFNKPIIFVDLSMSASECIEKCKELTECVTVSLSSLTPRCTIFNATLEILREKFKLRVVLDFEDFIREKRCLE